MVAERHFPSNGRFEVRWLVGVIALGRVNDEWMGRGGWAGDTTRRLGHGTQGNGMVALVAGGTGIGRLRAIESWSVLRALVGGVRLGHVQAGVGKSRPYAGDPALAIR